MILAHILTGSDGSFLSGLEHPILGFDHFLAMVSIGLITIELGKKAMGLVPFTFALLMALGGICGFFGITFGLGQIGIAVSIFALGIAIYEGHNLKMGFTLSFVAIYAFFHGYVHIVEMPHFNQTFFYILGFSLGTIILYLVGLGIGVGIKKTPQNKDFLRFLGSAIAGIGFHLIITS